MAEPDPVHEKIVVEISGRSAQLIRLFAERMRVQPDHLVAYSIGYAIEALSNPVEMLRASKLIADIVSGNNRLEAACSENLDEKIRLLRSRRGN